MISPFPVWITGLPSLEFCFCSPSDPNNAFDSVLSFCHITRQSDFGTVYLVCYAVVVVFCDCVPLAAEGMAGDACFCLVMVCGLSNGCISLCSNLLIPGYLLYGLRLPLLWSAIC